jgi:hypothetical protein
MDKQRPMKGELRRFALCNIPTVVFTDVTRPAQTSVSFKNETSVKLFKYDSVHMHSLNSLWPNFTAQNKKSLTNFVMIKIYQ